MSSVEKRYTLIYDSGEEAFVHDTLKPMLADMIGHSKVFKGDAVPEVQPEEQLILYLGDHQIKKLLPGLIESKAVIAVLPHPDAFRICAITGTGSDVGKAVEHLKSDAVAREIDLLYCNERPIFSSVVVGSNFLLTTSKFYMSIGLWKRIRILFGSFLKLRPFRLEITKKDGSVLKAAVSGIVAVPYRTYSWLSRLIPGTSFHNDGMFHILMISPRSIMELMRNAVRSLWKMQQFPAFGAHIRTDKLTLSGSGDELTFTEDGDNRTATEISLETRKKQIRIIPGEQMEVPEGTPETNEIFRTGSLPLGEAARELTERKLPLIRRATTEEFRDLFEVLRGNAQVKGTYLMLMVLSTILATFGLFADSAPVVIGAMILAPLMAPIISLSMATLRQEKKLILGSIYTILAGLGLSFAFAVAITWVTPIHTPNSEIMARTSPNLLDLGIAVTSGVAGAYAHAREEVAKTLAGVAIAVALVPPLAVAGIGLGWMDWNVFSGATLLLLTNLAGMVLAGSVTFLLLGYSPFRLATKGVFVSLAAVVIFSIPLYLGFQHMIFERNVIRALDGWQAEQVTLRDVRIQGMRPLTLSVTMVADEPLDKEQLAGIKQQIEAELNREVELEIVMALRN
ncbi:TIGR00341 family protein [Balneolales bacterium ANBcel1]|nr:TIGR00341 family protein [Balneolales bacterium ANBcel1]